MSKMFITGLLFLATIVPGGSDLHTFYVSKCLVEYVEAEQTIQVTLHIFLDDLEQALQGEGGEKLHLTEASEKPEADRLLAAYLTKHFSIKTDRGTLSLSYLGKELSDDYAGLWCYLEAAEVSPPRMMEVENTILTELFEDQQNIVNIRYSDKQEAFFILTKQETRQTATF